MYVIQSKNGIMMNVSVNVKKYMIGILVKMISTCDCKSNKACKIDEYCEDEISNTTETSLVDTKLTCEKIISLFTLFHW